MSMFKYPFEGMIRNMLDEEEDRSGSSQVGITYEKQEERKSKKKKRKQETRILLYKKRKLAEAVGGGSSLVCPNSNVPSRA